MTGERQQLTDGEQGTLEVMAALHKEFGITAWFPSDTIAVAALGPVPGSLAGLVMFGYCLQRIKDGRVCYSLTERAWARIAGVPEDLVGPDPRA